MHVYSARPEHIDKLAEIAGAAFENYPLHTAVKGLLADPEEFPNWIRDVHAVMIRVFARYHTVLVLEDQGEILGVALLNHRPPGLLEYLRYCRPLLGYMRFDRLVRFFAFTEAADAVVRRESDFDWFLTVIAVDPSRQHQGIGRRFLERGIEGYVRSHGGGRLAFITCTPTNARFYSSAGYRVVGEHSVSLDGNEVPVWSFEKVIE